MRYAFSIFVLAILWMFPGCKSQSVDIADRSVALLEGALIVLEENQDTPERAPENFREYMQRNQQEVDALAQMVDSISKAKNNTEHKLPILPLYFY